MKQMSIRSITATLFLFFMILVLTACNFSGSESTPGDQNANATATAVFQTLDAQSAELTAQAGGAVQPPAETEQPPADTQAPAQTEPEVVQPGQPTAQGGVPVVIASANTNCRSGPSKKYPKLSNLGMGLRANILGKDATNEWLYVQNEKKVSSGCWVSLKTVTVEGDIATMPIIEAMPLEAAQTQAAQTVIPQAPVAPVIQTPNITPNP
jgi:uncharacterized protein YgiM (DUF1202 family)